MSQKARDFKEMMHHIAEEVNVNNIILNGVIVYSRPSLNERTKAKQRQFDEIYNEYPEEKK